MVVFLESPLRETWILLVWWSLWSLADTYLLQFSPVPELLLLALCGAIFLGHWYDQTWRVVARAATEELAKVTQTDA